MESIKDRGNEGWGQYTGLRSIQLKSCTFGLMNAVMMAGAAHAQSTNGPANVQTNSATQLPDVVVSGQQDSYKAEEVASPRFMEPLRDIPQTITVIPQAVMQEQN